MDVLAYLLSKIFSLTPRRAKNEENPFNREHWTDKNERLHILKNRARIFLRTNLETIPILFNKTPEPNNPDFQLKFGVLMLKGAVHLLN